MTHSQQKLPNIRELGKYTLENLQISFHMTQPVINRHFLTLDAVLSRAMYNATGSVEKALNDLPIKRTEDLYHASSLRLMMPIRYVPVDFVAGLKGEIDLSTMNYSPDGKKYKIFDDKRNQYKVQMDKYSAQYSSEAVFYVCGDPEKIDQLMSFIDGLGKKTNQGIGGFHRYAISTIEHDWSLYQETLKVMRPIPKTLFAELYPDVSVDNLSWDKVAYKGPYWDKENQLDCYVPDNDRVPLEMPGDIEFDDVF